MQLLYLFGIYCVNLLISQNIVQARIIIVDCYEKRVDDFLNRFATIFSGEIDGYMETSIPPDACTEIRPPTFPQNYTLNKIVLINGTAKCNFMTKVQNARSAGYDAAVLFDPYPGFDYPNLTFPLDVSEVNLSVFLISYDDAIRIDKFLYHNISDKENFIIKIFSGMTGSDWFYLLCIITGLSILPFAVWECLKCCVKALIRWNTASNNATNPGHDDHLDIIRNEFRNIDLIIASMFGEQNRTTALRNLERTFPSTEFSQEDDSFQTCVICYNNFQIGETIRVLGCFHTYHAVCIDEWFVEKHFLLTCPLCKQLFRLESASVHSFLDSTESSVPLLNPTNGQPSTSGEGDNSSSASESMYSTPVGSVIEYRGFLAGPSGSVNSA